MLTRCGQHFEPVCTDLGGGVTRTPERRAPRQPDGRLTLYAKQGCMLSG